MTSPEKKTTPSFTDSHPPQRPLLPPKKKLSQGTRGNFAVPEVRTGGQVQGTKQCVP